MDILAASRLKIAARTFWWVSQLGMLAGTSVYVYAGSSVPGLWSLADEGMNAVFSPNQLTQLMTVFVLLGIFPVAVRGLMKLGSHTQPANAAGGSATEGGRTPMWVAGLPH